MVVHAFHPVMLCNQEFLFCNWLKAAPVLRDFINSLKDPRSFVALCSYTSSNNNNYLILLFFSAEIQL